MYFGVFDPTIIILIPAIVLTFYAQSKVNSAYHRYSAVRNRRGITGAQAARRILDSNGLYDVPIEISRGRLTDHYDPRKRVIAFRRRFTTILPSRLSALPLMRLPMRSSMPADMCRSASGM